MVQVAKWTKRRFASWVLPLALLTQACLPSPPTVEALGGAWLLERDGHQLGMMFHPNGQLSLIGYANLYGERWRLDPGSETVWLTVQSHREVSTFPLQIRRLKEHELRLEGESELAGEYQASDAQVAMVHGEVHFAPVSEHLSPALLTLVVEDLTLPEVVRKPLVSLELPIKMGDTSKSFSLVLLHSQIEPQHLYGAKAILQTSDPKVFQSSRHFGVAPLQPNGLVIELREMNESLKTNTSHL